MLRQDAGLRIKHMRWAQRMSLRELSEKSNVSTTTIQKIEKGNLNVQGQVVYAIADALGIEPKVLFEPEEVSS